MHLRLVSDGCTIPAITRRWTKSRLKRFRRSSGLEPQGQGRAELGGESNSGLGGRPMGGRAGGQPEGRGGRERGIGDASEHVGNKLRAQGLPSSVTGMKQKFHLQEVLGKDGEWGSGGRAGSCAFDNRDLMRVEDKQQPSMDICATPRGQLNTNEW